MILLIAISSVLLAGAALAAGDYGLDWWTVDGGGGRCQSAAIRPLGHGWPAGDWFRFWGRIHPQRWLLAKDQCHPPGVSIPPAAGHPV